MVPTRQTPGDESICSISLSKTTAKCYGYKIIMMRTVGEESFERERERERVKVMLAGESKHSGNQSHICPVENYVLI